uniref:Uncharacterized protein n=1 Tax=viral metagenome TaxID=1070528 RepID=A0A6M3KU50_9ZZZZ
MQIRTLKALVKAAKEGRRIQCLGGRGIEAKWLLWTRAMDVQAWIEKGMHTCPKR